jgi:hypothetical protein
VSPSTRAPRKSSAERDAEVRAQLEPLAPGERPVPLTVATVAAVLLGLANLIIFAAGGSGGGAGGCALLAYCGAMFIVAWGMWQRSYLAVLAFEVLLAIIVVFFFLFLLRASNAWAVLLSLAIIVPAGWLFWKLIRVLARIQTPVEPR